MDEEHTHKVLPPGIVETAKRPDITIYSTVTKNIIIIALTVPLEENFANAKKKCKYEDLAAECENRGWTVYYFPTEVGSRGIYNTTLYIEPPLVYQVGNESQPWTQHPRQPYKKVQWLCSKLKGILTDKINSNTKNTCSEGRGTVEAS